MIVIEGCDKYYKMKHVPTGLYFQPVRHRGSHLSKKGKIYQTYSNGIETGNYGRKTFTVSCTKDSTIHKLTSSILNWVPCGSYNRLKAKTEFSDWVKKYI